MKSTKVVLRYAKAFFQYSLECKKEEKLAKEIHEYAISVLFAFEAIKQKKKTYNVPTRVMVNII